MDALNPRTQNRPLPSGRVSRNEVRWLIGGSVALVLLSCWQLNLTAVLFSPLIFAIMWVYPYLKRFSWVCHFVLGGILGCAPVLGWLGVTGEITWQPIVLGLAVLFWVSGFDIFYSTQDFEFDKEHALWSLPSLLGVALSLWIAKTCHAVTFILLLFLGWQLHLGGWYWMGLVITGTLLYYQHRIVTPYDLSKVNRAFFVINGWMGIILFFATLLDVL